MAQGIEAAHDFAIKPLFAEPYFIANIGHAISSKQIDFIKSVKMQQNQMNHISEHLYLLRRPELASVRKAVDSALVSFAQEVLGIRHELAVTQSWALMNPPGVGMHEHTHSNSLVSGSLYYAPLPDPPGNMVFERTNGYRQIEMAVAEEKTNIYNAQRKCGNPEAG